MANSMASIVEPTGGGPGVPLTRFVPLDATAQEVIESGTQGLGEPRQGTTLLSCGTQKLAPDEKLWTCPSTTFTLANYSRLLPERSRDIRLRTEFRGITLAQLSEVVAFIKDHARFWCETYAESTHYGAALPPEAFNLHHANDWIIKPATREARGGQGCSYVELIAVQAEAQRPTWFVSHAWLEPVVIFYGCLEKHANLRCLTLDTAYWVCAYANNQHALQEEMNANPRKTSFYKAMQMCTGVLLILDHDDRATAIDRAWCCFEQSIVVSERDAGTSRLLLDVAAADKDKKAHVITDGFAAPEQSLMPLLGFFAKSRREASFPNEILRKGLEVNIQQAGASIPQDKEAILNSIAFPRARTKALTGSCHGVHPAYDAVNQSLASHFALAAFFGAIKQGKDTSRLLEALKADVGRRVVELSLTGCHTFQDLELQALLEALPRQLAVLRLDLGFTAIQTVTFPEMPALKQLMLRFTGSSLRDASGLCAVLTPQLQLLHLWFSNLQNLEELGHLSKAISTLRVEELVLQLSGCPNVRPESKQQLLDATESLRRQRWRSLDAWIHIEDAERWSWLKGLVPVLEAAGFHHVLSGPISLQLEPVASTLHGLQLAQLPTVDSSRLVHAKDMPFPCSYQGCTKFHENLNGFCQQHCLHSYVSAVSSRCLTAWRWLELGLLFFVQAVAEMESKALLLAILLSLYLVAILQLITPSPAPSSTSCVVVTLSMAGLCSLAWTWNQFDRMQKVARQVALSLEARYSAVLQAKEGQGGTGAPLSTLAGLVQLDELGECLARSNGSSQEHFQTTSDLRDLFTQAQQHLPRLETAVTSALADLPDIVVKPYLRLLTDLSSDEWQRPEGLLDLLSCEVHCDGLSQVEAALMALKAWFESEESHGSFQILDVLDGFAKLGTHKYCQVIISSEGYVQSIFLVDPSLDRLEMGMAKMYELANFFGLLDEVKPQRWETSQRLWEPPQSWSVIAATTVLRVVALLVAFFFAAQYFIRYAPAKLYDVMPGTLRKATFMENVAASEHGSWQQATLLSLPYFILVVVFAGELLPTGLPTAMTKRAKPTQVLYESSFGLCGSHYALKVLVLQFGSVLLQAFGKLRLLGALVTLAKHEAPQSTEPFITVFWAFCVLLAMNSIYPATLLVLPDANWLRAAVALMDVIMDLGFMACYLLTVLMALVQLQMKETVPSYYGLDFEGVSTQLQFSNRVPPGFAFPTSFWGYVAVYTSVAHVCCVCRMLRRSNWANLKFSARARHTGSKGWRCLGAVAYSGCLLLILSLLLISEDTYPGHSGNLRCFPCHCSVSGESLRLERCLLAEVLRLEQVSLHGRSISDIAPRAFNPLGCQLQRLSISGNPLARLPPSSFAGLRCLQVLDLGQAQLAELHDDDFRGLEQLKTLTLSENRLRRISASTLRHLPALENLVLGGVEDDPDGRVVYSGSGVYGSLPADLFAGNPKLVKLDLSHCALLRPSKDCGS